MAEYIAPEGFINSSPRAPGRGTGKKKTVRGAAAVEPSGCLGRDAAGALGRFEVLRRIRAVSLCRSNHGSRLGARRSWIVWWGGDWCDGLLPKPFRPARNVVARIQAVFAAHGHGRVQSAADHPVGAGWRAHLRTRAPRRHRDRVILELTSAECGKSGSRLLGAARISAHTVNER